MPSPVGHALGGLIVGLAFAPRRPHDKHDKREGDEAHQGRGRHGSPEAREGPFARVLHAAGAAPLVTWCIVAACLPDLDFLWGRHNLETHSVGFAVIVGLASLAWTRSALWAIAATLAVGTHVLFDWLGSDTTPPLGVMALWPFSREFYFADAFVFEAISRRYWLSNFVQHNVLAIVQEIAILAPIAALLWWFRGRGGHPEARRVLASSGNATETRRHRSET